jgi:hypothetical protein
MTYVACKSNVLQGQFYIWSMNNKPMGANDMCAHVMDLVFNDKILTLVDFHVHYSNSTKI